MKTREEMIAEWAKDPEIRAEYDKLEEEFRMLDMLLEARQSAGLTQAQVAERMKTSQSAVARMENGLTCGRLPSMSMLKRYAEATGKQLRIQFV